MQMRCLVLSPFVPFPPEDGGSVRIYEIMKGLSREHEVDLLTLAAPTDASWEAAAQLRQQGFEVETVFHQPERTTAALSALVTRRSFYSTLFYSAAFARAVDARLREKSYDIVQ